MYPVQVEDVVADGGADGEHAYEVQYCQQGCFADGCAHGFEAQSCAALEQDADEGDGGKDAAGFADVFGLYQLEHGACQQADDHQQQYARHSDADEQGAEYV